MKYVLVEAHKRKEGKYLVESFRVSLCDGSDWKLVQADLPRDKVDAAAQLVSLSNGSCSTYWWYECIHCGNNRPHQFMVKDSVWAKAGLSLGEIHLECLEAVLGRKLTADDFDLDIRINHPIRFGFERGNVQKVKATEGYQQAKKDALAICDQVNKEADKVGDRVPASWLREARDRISKLSP